MPYFNCRDVAAISVCAALWGVLNTFFAPLFFRATGLPFLCDLIGFTVLIIAVWWTRKFGAITVIGLVATGISFVLNPGGIHFLGFAAASFVFDLLTRFIGIQQLLWKIDSNNFNSSSNFGRFCGFCRIHHRLILHAKPSADKPGWSVRLGWIARYRGINRWCNRR